MNRAQRLSTVWLTVWLAGCVVLPLLVVGCDALPSTVISPGPATPVVDSVTITDTVTALQATSPRETNVPAVPGTPPVAPTSDVIPPTGIQLTLWTMESVSTDAEGEAGQAFADGIQAFEQRYPGVSVSVQVKNQSGKGSVLDYLRTASTVAPSVLPDVVVLDVADVAIAARAGVLVALDGHIAPPLINDLLPGARMAGTSDGQLVGIPFDADVEHLVFNTNKVAQAPLTWEDVLGAGTTYRFPAKGHNGLVSDSFLIQYFALGGRLADEEGMPLLDEPLLMAVLEYYRSGVEDGVIPVDVLTATTADDLWAGYAAADTGMAHVRAGRFLQDRSQLRGSQYADIPTRDGKPVTIIRGRVLAVTTRDPARLPVAVSLIEWMMEPDNAVVWHRATDTLPTRYVTLQRMGDDGYWEFLRHALEAAVPPPYFPQYDQVGRVLQQAVVEVIAGDSTPREAAAAAVDAIGR